MELYTSFWEGRQHLADLERRKDELTALKSRHPGNFNSITMNLGLVKITSIMVTGQLSWASRGDVGKDRGEENENQRPKVKNL